MIWLSTEYFHFMGICTFTNIGNSWVLINAKSARQRRLWEISVFSLTFPVLCKFTFPIFWELYGFLLHPKYLRNPLLWNVCVFTFFSYYGNSLFSIFWKLYGSLLHSKQLSNPLLWNVCFSHTFPVLWEFTFPKFWKLYGFLLYPKYLRNP